MVVPTPPLPALKVSKMRFQLRRSLAAVGRAQGSRFRHASTVCLRIRSCLWPLATASGSSHGSGTRPAIRSRTCTATKSDGAWQTCCRTYDREYGLPAQGKYATFAIPSSFLVCLLMRSCKALLAHLATYVRLLAAFISHALVIQSRHSSSLRASVPFSSCPQTTSCK